MCGECVCVPAEPMAGELSRQIHFLDGSPDDCGAADAANDDLRDAIPEQVICEYVYAYVYICIYIYIRVI